MYVGTKSWVADGGKTKEKQATLKNHRGLSLSLGGMDTTNLDGRRDALCVCEREREGRKGIEGKEEGEASHTKLFIGLSVKKAMIVVRTATAGEMHRCRKKRAG